MSNHSFGHASKEKRQKHDGVWNECLEVMRFAFPVGQALPIQVTDCVNLVLEIEIHCLNAMKQAKHTGVQNVG